MDDALIDRWVQGRCTLAEREALLERLAAEPALGQRIFAVARFELDLLAAHRRVVPKAATPVQRMPISLCARRPRRPVPYSRVLTWVSAAAVVAAAVALGIVAIRSPPIPVTALLVEVAGEVEIDARSARAGSPLNHTSQLTVARGASAVVRFNDGSIVTAGDGRAAAFSVGETQMTLADGRVHVRAAPQGPGRTFRIVTPILTVAVVGTIFSVDQRADSCQVAVSAGRVQVRRRRDGQVLELGPGQELAVAATDVSALAPVPLPGPQASNADAASSGVGAVSPAWTNLNPEDSRIELTAGRDGALSAVRFSRTSTGMPDDWFSSIVRPFVVPPEVRHVALWLRVEHSDVQATWEVVLRETDHDCWRIGSGRCRDFGEGWRRVALAFDDPEHLFGDGTALDLASVFELQVSISAGDAVLGIDDVEAVPDR